MSAAALHVVATGDRDWGVVKQGMTKEEERLARTQALVLFQAVALCIMRADVPVVLAHGGAHGADALAAEAAKAFDETALSFPADWKRYGKGAGPARNRKMINEHRPDLVLAFHDALFSRSRGTRDCVLYACEKGHRVLWYKSDGTVVVLSEGLSDAQGSAVAG